MLLIILTSSLTRAKTVENFKKHFRLSTMLKISKFLSNATYRLKKKIVSNDFYDLK